MDLLAALATPVAVTVTDEISVGRYFKVHCRAAGCAPLAFKERFNVIVEPAFPEPGDKLNAADCPKPRRHTATARRERRDHLARAMDRSIIKTPYAHTWVENKLIDLAVIRSF
jgi:hypothetical protein